MNRIQRLNIEKLYISSGHDFKGRFGKGRLCHETNAVERVDCVAGKGILGDRYYGYKENFKGQITFIERSTIEAVETMVGDRDIDPRLFRRNVVTSGVDLNELIGRRFRIGEVVFSGSEECSPCFWMDETIREGVLEAMKGRGGLRCRIEASGSLALGERILELLDEGDVG